MTDDPTASLRCPTCGQRPDARAEDEAPAEAPPRRWRVVIDCHGIRAVANASTPPAAAALASADWARRGSAYQASA